MEGVIKNFKKAFTRKKSYQNQTREDENDCQESSQGFDYDES